MTFPLLPPLIGFTAGLCVTLALRHVLRRHFGAGCAYGAWMLPPMATLAELLPKMNWTPALPAGMPQTLHAVMATAEPASAPVATWTMLAYAIWALGATALLARLSWHYLRMHLDMRFLHDDLRDSILSACPGIPLRSLRVHRHGPAVVVGVPCRIVLPPDFAARFDHEQRQLILMHERTHLRRGDAWWNLLAELLSALLWFHPLIWFARSRFRLDQELACDAHVLLRHPQSRRGYAHALLQGIDRPAIPAMAAWFDEPHLKERLQMIHDLARQNMHRRTGVLVLLGLLTCSVFAAQAMQSAPAPAKTSITPNPTPSSWTTKQPSPIVLLHPDQAPAPGYATPPSSVPSFKQTHPPRYPKEAIKNHLEGTVVLLVKVGTDGKALKVKAKPGKTDPSLVKSAIDAARQWLYNPATDAKGHAVVAWVKVPVTFSMDGYTAPKK